MKKLLDKIIFSFFLIITFFLPLISIGVTNELYEFPKMIFLYFTGTFLIFMFILKVIIYEQKLIMPDKLLLLFLFTFFISALFSSHLYTSIWGYYTRFNDGLGSHLLYLGVFWVGLNTLDRKKVNILLNAALLGMIPIVVQGLMQIGVEERVYSTFGQPNWLAAYMLMIGPIVIQKIIYYYKNNQRSLSALILFYFLLFLFVFLFTKSLSGFIGLGISLVLFVLLSIKNLSRIKIVVLILITFFLFTGISFFLRERLSDAINFSAEPESYSFSDTGLIRLGLWKGTLSMWLASPKNFLLGVGPETFTYNYPFFRQNILNYSSEWDFIMNKPHNYYLEILSETGIILFILYILLIRKIYTSKDIYIKISLTGFLAANIFGWPTVPTSYLFWLFLCFIYIYQKDEKKGSL